MPFINLNADLYVRSENIFCIDRFRSDVKVTLDVNHTITIHHDNEEAAQAKLAELLGQLGASSNGKAKKLKR